jgi:hypothetical protein
MFSTDVSLSSNVITRVLAFTASQRTTPFADWRTARILAAVPQELQPGMTI